jgi:L-fuconolactonase
VIVDTHAHVSSPDAERYPRQPISSGNSAMPDLVEHARRIPALPAEKLLAENAGAGIDATVVVQMFSRYAYDNSYAADAVARHPGKLALVVTIDPTMPDAAETLSYWVRERGAHGVRLLTSTHPDQPWLDDPRTHGLWDLARALDITICVQIFADMAPRLRNILARFPDQRVALDHLGYPALDDGPPYEKAAPLFSLADYSNLCVKFSTDNIVAAAKGKSTQRQFFERLVADFGVSRLMWSSNYNMVYSPGLKEQLATALEIFSFLADGDRERVFGGNALRLWPTLNPE